MWSIIIGIAIALGLIFLLGIGVGKWCQLSNNDRDDFPRLHLVRSTPTGIKAIKQRRMNK
ncbi:MAG TPA: hypothetical protein DCR97_08730 [Deltaproteobacteria bacterium]|jgi:hypothetical protein|nr:hypothetical protein [Deltaproteobacteria bacterium]